MLQSNLNEEEVSEKEIYARLAAPFPPEAYSVDESRGFALTSLKAQYVRERLNEVFGIMNWSFGGEYKETEKGVVFMGALVINVNGKTNRFFAPGYSDKKSNLGDTYKGANTDSLCKCASNIGVGNDVFKGLIDPAEIKKARSASKPSSAAYVKRSIPIQTSTASTTKEEKSTPSVAPKKFADRVKKTVTTKTESSGDDIGF